MIDLTTVPKDDIVQILLICDQIYRGVCTEIKYKNIHYTEKDLPTDQQYDDFYKIYQKQVEELRQKIPSRATAPMIKHYILAQSVEKFTDLEQMIKRLSKAKVNEIILEPKYDGASLIFYIRKNSLQILSKNDKEFGYDVTNKCQGLIKQFLPKIQQLIKQKDLHMIIVRAELIAKKDTIYQSHWVDKDDNIVPEDSTQKVKFIEGYSTLRAFASAQMTDQQELDCKVFDSPFYQFLQIDNNKKFIPNTQLEQIQFIKEYLNYNLPHQVIKLKDMTMDILTEFFKNNNTYQCDGIVVCDNQFVESDIIREKPLLQKLGFKFEQQLTQSIVTKIEWSVNQGGILYPIVYFNKINIEGKNLDKATGNNVQYLYNNDLAPGNICQVKLAGGVIPNIIGVQKSPKTLIDFIKQILPNECPQCHDKIEIKDNEFYCKNYNDKCNLRNLLSKIKDIFNMVGFGPVKQDNLFFNKNFSKITFQNWFISQNFTITIPKLAQIFLDNCGKVKANKITQEELINHLQKLKMDLLIEHYFK